MARDRRLVDQQQVELALHLCRAAIESFEQQLRTSTSSDAVVQLHRRKLEQHRSRLRALQSVIELLVLDNPPSSLG